MSAHQLEKKIFISQFPGQSYRDFHADIFPLTRGVEAALVPELWMQGKNAPVPKISLDPTVVKNDELKVRERQLFVRINLRLLPELEIQRFEVLALFLSACRSNPIVECDVKDGVRLLNLKTARTGLNGVGHSELRLCLPTFDHKLQM